MYYHSYTHILTKTRKRQVQTLCMVAIFLLHLGCASSKIRSDVPEEGVKVSARHGLWMNLESKAEDGTDRQKFIPAGEVFYLYKDRATVLEAPGRLSTIIMPPLENTESMTLNLPIQKEWEDKNAQILASKMLWKVIPQLKRVEELFSARNYSAALPIVQELRSKYSHFEYLRWVEASCLWNMGQRVSARLLFDQLKDSVEQAEIPPLGRKPASKEEGVK